MLCRRIQQKLNSHDWQFDSYRQDADVMAHLDICPRCRSLVQAEEALRSDLRLLKHKEPSSELTLNDVRRSVEAALPARSIGHARGAHSGLRTALVFGLVGVVIIFLVFVPFTFREKVGYEIAIAGVDKNIAQGSQDITPLFRALGMEKDQATDLVDSLGGDKVRFSVGECSETCHLRISDLKTERDVKLVVNAIIALGCCQIDKIIPIFRDESTSLLGHAVRKLNS